MNQIHYLKYAVVVLFVGVLFSQPQLPGNNGNKAEVFIEISPDTSIYIATVEDRFAMEMAGNLMKDPSLDSANSKVVPDISGWVGFDYWGLDRGLESIGRGLYKIYLKSSPIDLVYFDTRDCDYIIHNVHNTGSPDLFINSELSFFTFYNWRNYNNFRWISLSPRDTIRLGWAWLTDTDLANVNSVQDLPNNNNYDCFEHDFTLINKFNSETISDGTFIIPSYSLSIQSGSTATLKRAENVYIYSQKYTTYNAIQLTHHHWMEDSSSTLLKNNYVPDLSDEIYSYYLETKTVTLTTSLNYDIPISIHDPWYVKPGTQWTQQDTFHVLNQNENPGGSYNVFINEGTGAPSNWSYAISVPVSDTIINSNHYIFSGWEASGALLAPHPDYPNDELVKKVFFQSEGALVKARYINLSALDGSIYSTLTISGDVNVTGNVTIEPVADVTFASGSTIRFNPGTKLIVKGNLSAGYTTFTRSDPNSSSRTYWEGIETQSSGTTWIGHSTIEGAMKG